MNDPDLYIRLSPESYQAVIKIAEERGYHRGYDRAYQLGKELLEMHENASNKAIEGLVKKYVDLFMSRGE
jgi:uncharacterized protein YihD (DUF1040 family)